MPLLTDLYQLTMMQGYYNAKKADGQVVFDLFYRSNPSKGGYAIMAGLDQVIEYINNLTFNDEHITYLESLNIFDKSFLNYLKDFKFSGDIYAIPEGSVIFPKEPLIRVKAPLIEAQFIETTLLNIINHQSLIATKASRVCWAAKGDGVLEFGLRRAQGPDAGLYGSRAAIIGGCTGTSNVLAGQLFNVPVSGTHAHSWVMSFDDELTAFRTYAKTFPDACILLVDTYDTLKSGVPNAIKVFNELKEQDIKPKKYGIRLDSGDLAYLSKEARKLLDAAGFTDAIISASSDLDENLISTLKQQGTTINLWGVGTRLITSADCPAFGGVYKLAAEENAEGELLPKIKLSDNPEKVTNPGLKKLYRIYDKRSNKIKADLITLGHEEIDATKPLTLFDPNNTWKRMTLKAGSFEVRDMLESIFIDGSCVYKTPEVTDIRSYCQDQLNTLWPESRRLVNPHVVPVDLSHELFDLKSSMIEHIRAKNK